MKKAFLAFLGETAACLLLAFLPMLFALWPQDNMTVLSVLASHILYPLCALFLPLFAVRMGGSTFFCALIPFTVYIIPRILLGITLPALPTVLTLLLAVMGANIGAEINKRAGANKNRNPK